MSSRLSRCQLLRAALALPAGVWLSRYNFIAAPFAGQVKITAIKAMQLDFQFDGCLIRIETDTGIVGYGETGTNAQIARAHLEHMTGGSFPGSTNTSADRRA